MDFKQNIRTNNNEKNYHIENLKLTREFSKKLILEMKELVRSIVLFGSNTNDTLTKDSDIDLMIVLDNISIYVSDELREAYHIIINNLSENLAKNKFHILTVNLSDLWDMARKGDPLLINILRFGVPIFDRDLIKPLQYLLEMGKIRPTIESIYSYRARSNQLIENLNIHLRNMFFDLYYSVVDIVHSALMVDNILPPSPREMPELFEKNFKNNKQLLKYSELIKEIYNKYKELDHNKTTINEKEIEKYKKKVIEMNKKLNKYIEDKINLKEK
jgi:predicted nucleotidyltransferase